MCGIAGILGRTDLDINKMSELIAHRGPDGSGLFVGEMDSISLAHRRLAIIDPEQGKQPMITHDGRFAIVFNGEIYNYKTLKQELEKAGHVFYSNSDTEVILLGYSEYYTEILNKLQGMFAFAIWDTSKKELFIARDRIGIKPLFYKLTHNGLAFASEMKALLGDVRELNLGALANYLQLGFRTSPETLFSGVMELPPASWMRYKLGYEKPVLNKYWDKESFFANKLTIEENAHNLRDALNKASISHLISDVPLGFWLSGGLDSSIILSCVKNQIPPESRTAFTLAYGLDNDETPYAKHMAEEAGVNWHLFNQDLSQAKNILEDLIWHLEEPLPNITAVTSFFLASKTNKYTKVVLIGEGSDELFAGYPTYIPFTGPWRSFPPALKSWAMEKSYLFPSKKEWISLSGALLKPMIKKVDFNTMPNNLDSALKFDISYELVQSQLARIDRLTMAHGIEARVPFLDHKVVEMALQIPSGQKRRGNQTKIILREAFKKALPEKIINRPKYGKKGTQGITQYFFDNVMHGLIKNSLTITRINELGYFDAEQIHKFLKRPTPSYYQKAKKQKTIYFLVLFDLWHRIFIEKETTYGAIHK